MIIDDQTRDEKLQYDINREAAKISALLSNKIDNFKYLTGEEILPSNLKQIIEQAKFTCSTENKITIDKNGENVPHLETADLVLLHCNTVNNDYQQDSRVLYTFFPNKPFGSLLEISPTNVIPLKTFNSEFQVIEVWFTDQNSQPLEIEDRMNLTLVIT